MLTIGIDLGKFHHAACLLSTKLLSDAHQHVALCPSLTFEQSRIGFDVLRTLLIEYAPLDNCRVVVESTGHYGAALIQYLQEYGVAVYEVHPSREKKTRNKSDTRDAQYLATLLYNQLERGVLPHDESERARLLVPPSESLRRLRTLVQHREELVRECTRRRNKLTAICDEIMPELSSLYEDVNCPSALALREQFPTPEEVGTAEMDDLLATRKRYMPRRDAFRVFQEHALHSIGTRNQERRESLLLEQTHLIAELRLLQEHTDAMEDAIRAIMSESREGQILMSFPGIDAIHGAILLAFIGGIRNYESAAKLRAYCGWSPHQSQTGVSKDSMTLNKSGHPLLKKTLYLIALNVVRHDTQWRILYRRLVPIKCQYDERRKTYIGKMKVIGRIIGQMVRVIYRLLTDDALLVARSAAGTLPPPTLYERARHVMNGEAHAASPL